MSWVSDFWGTNIDPWQGKFEVGTPQPIQAIGRLPQVIQNLPQDVANLANPAGLALAAAIRNAKSQASNGARPVPGYIVQQLQAFFGAELLASVLYNTLEVGRISLDGLVLVVNNHVEAITLEDIVVFRTEADAQQDTGCWAHELTHVLQYRARGIDTFANTYTTNSWVLENEAIDNAARITQTIHGVPVQSQEFAYFEVTGQYLYGDAAYNLYPADRATGQVLGPPNGRVVLQNGQYWAIDGAGRAFPATRLR